MSQGGEGKGQRVFEVQNDIGAKPFRKKKILHSDHFSIVGGKLEGEKIGEPSELSGSLGTRENECRSTSFFPFCFSHSAAWSGYDQLRNNSCAAGS